MMDRTASLIIYECFSHCGLEYLDYFFLLIIIIQQIG